MFFGLTPLDVIVIVVVATGGFPPPPPRRRRARPDSIVAAARRNEHDSREHRETPDDLRSNLHSFLQIVRDRSSEPSAALQSLERVAESALEATAEEA